MEDHHLENSFLWPVCNGQLPNGLFLRNKTLPYIRKRKTESKLGFRLWNQKSLNVSYVTHTRKLKVLILSRVRWLQEGKCNGLSIASWLISVKLNSIYSLRITCDLVRHYESVWGKWLWKSTNYKIWNREEFSDFHCFLTSLQGYVPINFIRYNIPWFFTVPMVKFRKHSWINQGTKVVYV